MAEVVEAGASLAWRLLATLEVGSILVATSALVAYTARVNLAKQRRHGTHCEPIWIGRCETVERAVDRTLAELLPYTTRHVYGFSIRNAGRKLSEYLNRWLKMTT
ncbi:jg13577 [Pararge aegeria aegeria]|uniref:Jg13577 protein n=1 Tax=Pararge aegeria aegeria TaxID=348720 RepID=A0A8S4QWG6_9NEOP|nr:jg13577 [Pararge aegeria aegeria]